MAIILYNTRTRAKEEFKPLEEGKVGMYHCGPTVYDYAHIGNLRAYIFADILRRTFELSDYAVRQIINITDVGHLVGDGDEGDDKMTTALKREGKALTKEAMQEVGDFYTQAFIKDLDALNIKRPTLMPRASDHITEDVVLINILLQKKHAYHTSDGIYFDTTTFPHYADFAQLNTSGMKAGIRVDIGEKKNPTDFSLWKFNDELGYEAPFGKGFPGWHIECSAMNHKYLGQPSDIHTGGVDHIPVHHTNEIAQSESAYGAPFVNYWMHSGFMTINSEKMSKSLGNTFRLADLAEKGVSPAAFRYWILSAKYDTMLNFTWEALMGAQKTIERLATKLIHNNNAEPIQDEIIQAAKDALCDDINTPAIIAELHKTAGTTLQELLSLLGIDITPVITKLEHTQIEPIPTHILTLRKERDAAKSLKNYVLADTIRNQIEALGFTVIDSKDGSQVIKNV